MASAKALWLLGSQSKPLVFFFFGDTVIFLKPLLQMAIFVLTAFYWVSWRCKSHPQVATGMNTRIGEIAKMMAKQDEEASCESGYL